MTLLGTALVWYAALALGGLGGLGLMRRLGADSGAGAALGRTVGWSVAGYIAWLCGFAGWKQWWLAGVAALLGLAVLGWPGLRRLRARDVIEAELIALAAFVVVAALRLPTLAVTATEKPMDLAILATLMRPGAIPPSDPWLAGTALPYYYWGFVPWIAPIRLLRLAPDVAFNLLVPLLAALTAQLAWGLARALGAGVRWARLAPLLAVLGGTPAGWRQLAAGHGLGSVDLWAASRQITGAITEFPLFTFQLGDLHPHLLALPLALAALLLAVLAAEGRRGAWPLTALMCGATAAANPWYGPPLVAAVVLLLIAPRSGFVWPWRGGLQRWGGALLVGAASLALFVPFWSGYHPPYGGVGAVATPTRWDELALFLGGVLALPVGVGWELSWRWGGLRSEGRRLMRAFWLCTVVVVSALSGSLALGLAVAIGGFFAGQTLRQGVRRLRPAWSLGLVPLALLAGMDLFFLRDPYGGEYYRMNSVFKASFLAFALLAVLAPVWGEWLHARRPRLAAALVAAVVVSGLPQLAALAARVGPPTARGWGGLGWMAEGEAAAAAWLRAQPPGAVLVEGVGEAYSDAARLSAASGVPTVLGWENHEKVWRGAGVGAELQRRRADVEALYRCGDAKRVQRLARSMGAWFIAVGSVERRLYPAKGLEAVLESGPAAFISEGCVLVRVGG
jgi:YYY domain-containing protein